MILTKGNIVAGSSKIWAGLNFVTELAKKTDVPAPYVHPSSKVCTGGDAGTLNGKTAAQIIAAATTGAIYVNEYIGNSIGDSVTAQQFALPSAPRAIIIFRIDGKFNNSPEMPTYPFGVVTQTSPYFHMVSKYNEQFRPSYYTQIIYINGNIVSVKNYTYNRQTSGFNESGVRYIILGLL